MSPRRTSAASWTRRWRSPSSRRSRTIPDGLIAPPALRAGWERTVTGLADPLDGHLRPLTFDAKVAENRDDVVLAHLEYPLVAQATRLLRSAIWGGRAALQQGRGAAVHAAAGCGVNGLLVAVFARLVLVGADGRRLHEEIILSGRIVPPAGPVAARGTGREPAPGAAQVRRGCPRTGRLPPRPGVRADDFASQWAELEPLLARDVQRPGEGAQGAPATRSRPARGGRTAQRRDRVHPAQGEPGQRARRAGCRPAHLRPAGRAGEAPVRAGPARRGEPAGTASRKRSSASLTRSSDATRTSANWSSRSPSRFVFRRRGSE